MSGADEEIFQNFLLHFETAVETDLRRHFLDSLNGEQVFDHELSSLDTPLASDGVGFQSIQVLEFKTSLLEAAEELHIHRDAEMRFEEQINKFVMEKQELEWEKDVMRALQQACQLLQAQTEALSRAERELSAQREERQESAQTQRVHVRSGPAGSYFPGPSAASVSTPPAGIAPRRPSPPDHAAECTPPEPGSDGNEQSKISARIGDTGRLQLPQKRKAEPEDHEVYTSTKQHSSWASLWEV